MECGRLNESCLAAMWEDVLMAYFRFNKVKETSRNTNVGTVPVEIRTGDL